MVGWLLERRSWNASKAAKELQVSRRTIMADIEYLRMFGYDFEYDGKSRSFWQKEATGDLVSLQLRQSEWAAIVLAQEIYESIGAHPIAEAMQRISTRVQALMPQLLGSHQSEFAPALSLVRGPAPEEPLPYLSQLTTAIRDQETVHMRYYTLYRDHTSERLVDPYKLVTREGRGYLVGFCHARNRVIIFRLDRIRHLKVTRDVFLIDGDFSLEDFLGPMFGMFTDRQTFNVKIRFSPYVATWIREEVWHQSQSMRDLPDGSVQLDMEVTGLTAVKKWIFGFGSDAEVLEPLHLRRDIAYELDKMTERYKRHI
jgi:predicted DNA-binding transcriptional regulator YafY